MRLLRYILFIVLLLLALSFALLNADPVSISYYLGTSQVPLSILLVFAFGMGCIIGLLVSMSWYLRSKWQARKLANRLELAEKELANLRTMPLKDINP